MTQSVKVRCGSILAVAGIMVASGCSSEPTPTPTRKLPPVVLIVIDCLRADHLGAYGYGQPTSPNIDALAAESVVFEHTIAQANWTKPAMASLLTGTTISQHGLREGRLGGRAVESLGELDGHTLSQSLVTWAEAMAALGYETAGFVNQGHLADYMGFDQGFDEYRFGLSDPQVEQEFAEWLQTREPGPFFAYLHLLDLHFPWNPPRHVDNFFAGEERPMRDLMNSDVGELRRAAEAGELSDSNVAELRAMYDGEVFVVDDRVGKILTALREVGVYDDAVIAVTADHGELLLEHGAFEHGGDFLYEGVLHIPWIMRLPGAEHAGARVSRTVQMADIFPTTTIFAGGTPPPDIAGQDALSLLGDPDRSWPIMAETSDPEGPRALYFGGYKFGFGRDSKVTVHDPRLDPMETRDLIDEIDASLLFGARQELLRLIAEHEDFQSRLTQTRAELRPEQVEKLRALGYIQ